MTDNYTENITDNFTENIYDNYTENVTDNFTENIYDNYTENVTDNFTDNIYDNYTENVTDNYTESITNNYTENVTNYTESITTENIVQKPKANVILLGFAKFIYIRTMRIVTFDVYFAHIREIIYTKILIITVNIKYKLFLRGLEESTTKNVECKIIDNNLNNLDKFNCSFDVNEKEIDNIKIDNLEFKDQDIDIIGETPLAKKFINNIQNIGDNDIFNKKLYILDNATSSIDNDNNSFNITGTINNKQFNYKNLNLTINSENLDEIHNISCNIIKINDENYTLQCNSKKGIKAQLDNAFSDLGNENLIVNFIDNATNIIDFKESDDQFKPIDKKRGLSTGGIIGIIAGCIGALAIIITIIICLNKKKPTFLIRIRKYRISRK